MHLWPWGCPEHPLESLRGWAFDQGETWASSTLNRLNTLNIEWRFTTFCHPVSFPSVSEIWTVLRVSWKGRGNGKWTLQLVKSRSPPPTVVAIFEAIFTLYDVIHWPCRRVEWVVRSLFCYDVCCAVAVEFSSFLLDVFGFVWRVPPHPPKEGVVALPPRPSVRYAGLNSRLL